MSNMHRLNDTSRYPYTFIANYSQIYNDLHMFFSIAVLFEHGKKNRWSLKKCCLECLDLGFTDGPERMSRFQCFDDAFFGGWEVILSTE